MKNLILLLLFIPLVFSCELRMSTEELKQEIKQNMIKTFAESDDWVDVKLVDFALIHKGGNEYKGMVDVIIENPVADVLNDFAKQDIINKNIEATYTVEVIYDGTTFSWEIIVD